MALVLLCLCPCLTALAVPAALAWRAGDAAMPAWRRGWPAFAAGLGLSLVAAVAAGSAAGAAATGTGLGAPDPVAAALGAAVLVGACGLLAAVLWMLPAALGAPPAVGQCLAAAVAVALSATPFYANPFIAAAEGDARRAVVAFTAGANPLLTLAHVAGIDDPLREPILYRVSDCQYYVYGYSTPGALAGTFAGAALVLGILAAGVAALRIRRAPPPAPAPGTFIPPGPAS